MFKGAAVGLLNAVFYPLFFIFSGIAIPLLSLGVILRSLLSRKRRVFYRFRMAIKAYGWVIIRILPWPWVCIRYVDRAPQEKQGPYIFVVNHPAASDAFLLACLPGEIVQIVNTWPFRIPVLGWFARWAGYLSIKEMPYEDFLARALKYIEEGVSLAVFPEGTRSGSKTMSQFHGAMMRAALKAKCPIVPVAIWGNKDIPARGTLWLKPGTVKVHKLKAVPYAEYAAMGPFKLKNYIRALIARELETM